MKPILLTMQAFGSYGEKTEIDFQKGGDFFLISGDTGSGKSTIFDAMMFALYGEVSTVGINKDKKKNEKLDEMLSQFVDVQKTKPYASLVFTAYQHGQEETYTVRRTPRYTRPAKRGDAKLQDERETVELLMPDGSQYPGKLSETNRKIEELVGLTADQFRKVVMIAQGEFMDFLRAGSKEKTELLRDLLKTDYYYQLSERLKTLAKDKNTAAKTQRANMSFFAGRAVTEGLPEEDAQALEAAKGTVITAKELQPEQVDTLAEVLSAVCARLQLQQGELAKQQTAAQNDRDECMKRIEAAQPLMQRFKELEDAEKTLQECAAQADEIEKKRGLIGKIRDAWAIEPKYQRMKDAQKALTDAQTELAAKQQELPQLKQTAADAAALHQQMEKAQQDATAHESEVKTKVKDALETFDALEGAEKALRQAEDADTKAKANAESAKKALDDFKKQEAELQGAEAAYEVCKQQNQQYRDLKKSLEELQSSRKDVQEKARQAAAAKDAYASATQKYQREQNEYDDYRLAFLNAQAGLLARELAPGKPCPVCGALEHPAPCQLTQENQQLNREQLEKLRKAADDAAKAQEEKAKESESAQVKRTERQKAAEEAEKKLVENAKNIRENVPMATAADVEAMLTAWLPELQSASKSVQAKVKALDDVRKNLDGAKEKREQLEKAAADAQETAKSTAVKKAEAEKTWKLHQEELSASPYRTREDAVAQRTQAQEAKQKAEAAASQAAEKERQAQKAETECTARIQQLDAEMPKKQANAEELNQQYQQTMAEKSLDEAQWQALTANYDAEEPDRLQKKVNDFDQKKNTAETQCTTAQSAIAGREKPDMAKLEAASKAAESALKEASDALEAAKHLRLNNEKVLEDLREGREPLANACKEANTAQHLSDVMAGTESGNRMNLETFVQRSYMEKILCDANRRFRDMSNGQFELKLINVEDAGEGKNKGLDLEVLSIVTDKTRSVNTLSGGESFMAALSLALGMADQIQAATAAIHLDVMFIDEGFGSLSDNARNEAVNILKEMAGKQRQIGIISHVSELKDEIENQLIVKKDDRGSHISWR